MTMFPAIGLRSTPKGGFGNRLLNYMNLHELSSHLEVPFFNPNQRDRRWIEGINRRPVIPLAMRRKVLLEREDLHRDDFLDRAKQWVAGGVTIIPKPRLLTDALVRYARVPPKKFVSHRFELCPTHKKQRDTVPAVVLHLRGGDFEGWKPGAVLGEEYYRDALALVDHDGFAESSVRICTDDQSHPALPGLRQFLTQSKRLVPLEGCEEPFSCDYAALIHAPRVISSPSTFAITAGLIGGGGVIHNKAWVDSRIQAGEAFWQAVRDNSVVGYDVLAEV